MQPASSRSNSAVNWLRVLLAMSIVGPFCLFVFAGWLNYRTVTEHARESVARLADVLMEHALRTIKINDIAVLDMVHDLNGLDDEAIGQREKEIHDALAALVEGLPEKQGLWVYDKEGHPLVTSAFYPIDRRLDLSERDYFRALLGATTQRLFISSIHHGSQSNTDYFSMARPRFLADGSFGGIVISSITPNYFTSFYARAMPKEGWVASLFLAEGRILARYPLAPAGQDGSARNPLAQAIAGGQDNGDYETARSAIDGEARLVSYRKVGEFPMYVGVGQSRSAVLGEWRSTMMSHLIFGVPATIALFTITLLALRSTRREMKAADRLRIEAERREQAEMALRQVQKLEAIGQLTGGIAHDFNNLLTVINGNLELLQRASGDRAQKFMAAIAQAARQGERLTRQLLTFSRRQALRPRPVDLTARLPILTDMLRRSLRGDIEFRMKAPGDLWPVEIDPGELELALLNLAVNARDAMPSGGELILALRNVSLSENEDERTGLQGDFVAVELSDNGSGMDEEVLERVFEPFFTTKDVGKGTGLGLSQVYGFAKQSGGAATIRSKRGGGTTVALYLPRSHAVIAAETVEEASGSLKLATARKALLVEDNPQVAEISQTLLQEMGFEVTHVENVRQALDFLERQSLPDLVVSDVVMAGGLSGLDLAREIKGRYPDLPMLLMTGYSESASEAKREGFMLLQKPFRRADLERALWTLAEQSKKRMPDLAADDPLH